MYAGSNNTNNSVLAVKETDEHATRFAEVADFFANFSPIYQSVFTFGLNGQSLLNFRKPKLMKKTSSAL